MGYRQRFHPAVVAYQPGNLRVFDQAIYAVSIAFACFFLGK